MILNPNRAAGVGLETSPDDRAARGFDTTFGVLLA